MALFSSSTPKESTPPNRSKREQCWDARDKYYQCLETNKVDNPLEDKFAPVIKKECSSVEKEFEANCASSWVHYFKEKYVVDLKKERFLKEMEAKGGQQLPFPIDRK
ncbi:CYFA0S10e03774g1_1 [Cyberlindnera fabianii]|uniref:CYFA0S10e03774g1_1 n=1 Tax=Cyberlindnera fabianii TaxID=36022 RepID=A0A061AZC6_CYBFA|nr:Cytochrome c oxidase assembly factor 6 [Cyberlindnera fabianii]CDR42914.1 CYFA0S10e03774g1_1 [Cyberlindnera fabianii]